MGHKSEVEYITIVDPDRLPSAELSTTLLEERFLAAKPREYLERAGHLLRAYETSGELASLQATIDIVLNNSGVLESALRRLDLSYDLRHPAVQCLCLMLERSTPGQRKKLRKLLSKDPESPQYKVAGVHKQDLPERTLWHNLPDEVEAFPFDSRSRKTHVTKRNIVVTQTWGLLVFDLSGRIERRILVPGRHRHSLQLGDEMFVATRLGCYRLSLEDWRLDQLGGASYNLVTYNGELWFEADDKAHRYRPGARDIQTYQLDSSWALEIRRGKLTSVGSNANFEWDDDQQAFVRSGIGKGQYSAPGYPKEETIKVRTGVTITKNVLHLRDGTKVELISPGSAIGSSLPLLADGEALWTSLHYGETLHIDRRSRVATIYPFNLCFYGGGANDRAVFFFGPGGVYRYLRETGTFRWFRTPQALGLGSWVWANEPVFVTQDRTAAHRYHFTDGTYEKIEMPKTAVAEVRARASSEPLPLLGGDTAAKLETKYGQWFANQSGVVFIGKGANPEVKVQQSTLEETPDLRARQKVLARSKSVEVEDKVDFLRNMAHTNPYVRAKAVMALPKGLFFPELVVAARDSSHNVREGLVSHLQDVNDPRVLVVWEALTETDDDRVITALAANGMAKWGRLPTQEVIQRASEHSYSCADLNYLLIDQGSEKQLEWFVDNPRGSDYVQFKRRLGERLATRPDLVDRLIQGGKSWLMSESGEVLVPGLKRALRSDELKVLEHACKMAKRLGSGSLSPDLLRLIGTGGLTDHYARDALQTCAQPRDFPALIELYRKNPEHIGLLRTILAVCPKEAQDLLIELSTHDSLEVRFLVVKGLAFGEDRERCIKVLRRLAEEDYRVEMQARVSLMAYDDPEAKDWVRGNLKRSFRLLENVPADVDLKFLRKEFSELSRQSEIDRWHLLTLLRKQPELADEPHLIWLSQQAESGERLFAARQLRSVRHLEALLNPEEEFTVYLAALVSLTNLGDKEGRERLAETCEVLRENRWAQEHFYSEMLRVKDLNFLSKRWLLENRLPTSVKESTYREFREKLSRTTGR